MLMRPNQDDFPSSNKFPNNNKFPRNYNNKLRKRGLNKNVLGGLRNNK